jgi:hypothetical protein
MVGSGWFRPGTDLRCKVHPSLEYSTRTDWLWHHKPCYRSSNPPRGIFRSILKIRTIFRVVEIMNKLEQHGHKIERKVPRGGLFARYGLSWGRTCTVTETLVQVIRTFFHTPYNMQRANVTRNTTPNVARLASRAHISARQGWSAISRNSKSIAEILGNRCLWF